MRCVLKFLSRNLSTASALRNTSRATEQAAQLNKSDATSKSTVDPVDLKHLSSYSDAWWDVNGQLKPLHSMNMLRIPFIRDGLANTGVLAQSPGLPLEGIRIIDIGCGGGILSEPLARIGANVTGLDASKELISSAVEHAKLDPGLSGRLNYVCTTMEEFAPQNENAYDAVVASEVVEHVNNKEIFLKCCAAVIKPGGSIFITTLNKTFQSWLGGIIIAEHLCKIVPPGTHEWDKFISPADTQRLLETRDCKTKLIHGMLYNPLKNEWYWSKTTMMHYALHAVKRQTKP